ncbi:hypothetical protein [Janthinobacterium agaricidamnosum]|uniref:hypothetical protein n=1 Tax=Janthinobacterium agaricidamnosum TaxID=55508 RepID=UPI00056DEB7F|nr:hypothetical protein [Janthinobacterium agaricidamnosum]
MADKSFWDGIPWAIAVIGWACTHFFSEARERRKEVRSQLDKFYEQLQKLEQDGRAFHCSEKFDGIKSADLITRIYSLERLLTRVKIVSVDNLNPYIIAVRRALTLNNFDVSAFVSQTHSSPIALEISAAIEDLELAIEHQYTVRYPNKFPYFQFNIRN